MVSQLEQDSLKVHDVTLGMAARKQSPGGDDPLDVEVIADTIRCWVWEKARGVVLACPDHANRSPC